MRLGHDVILRLERGDAVDAAHIMVVTELPRGKSRRRVTVTRIREDALETLEMRCELEVPDAQIRT